MDKVYANRLAMRQIETCAACLDYVSLIDCKMLGKTVWIKRSENEQIYGPFLVVDCAPPREQSKHHSKGHELEVSWRQAQQWRMTSPISTTVFLINSP